MRRGIIYLLALVFLLSVSRPVNAALMAMWDFGADATDYTLEPSKENVVGIPILEVGGGEYDINGKNGVAYRDSEGDDHIAGQAVAWDDVSAAAPLDDAYWIMTIDTTGFWDMTIRWDQWSDDSGAATGPTSFDFCYRIGQEIGGGQINWGSWIRRLDDAAIIRDERWRPFSYDLSGIPSIENHTHVQFRVNDLDRNDQNGDYKFDNLELTGVPEPATLLLLGLSSLMLVRRRGG